MTSRYSLGSTCHLSYRAGGVRTSTSEKSAILISRRGVAYPLKANANQIAGRLKMRDPWGLHTCYIKHHYPLWML